MSKGQLTGMRGVYLVAAELSRLGLIASPTSRGAMGADILVTDQACTRSFSVQVKTNARTFGFFLLNERAKEIVSPTHVYVLVNLRSAKGVDATEFFVVPSRVVAEKMKLFAAKTGSKWWALSRKDVLPYKDNWHIFEAA